MVYYGQGEFIMGRGPRPKVFLSSQPVYIRPEEWNMHRNLCYHVIKGSNWNMRSMANIAWIIMGRMSLLWGGAPNQKYFYHLNLFISALDSEICIGYFAITFIEGYSQNPPPFRGYYGQVRFIMGWGQKPKLFYHSKLYISALKSEICWGTSAITLLRGPIEIWGQLANTAWIIMGRMSLLWGGAPNQRYFYHLNLFISVLDSEICVGCFAITS